MTGSHDVQVRQANLADARDAAALVAVLDTYAGDPAGGSDPLSADVRARLVPALLRHPTTLVLIAFAANEPIGIAICFHGFSTFRARPLLNVHDLAVVPGHRGRGVGRALLQAAEDHALRAGCCKLTLEVQDDNARALGLYRSFGFEDFRIGGKPVPTRFLSKTLTSA